MSTFVREMTHPVTGKKQVALCIDNFYGRHQYGYAFLKDGGNASLFGKMDYDSFDFFTEEQIAQIIVENQQ